MAKAVRETLKDGRVRWMCWACWTDTTGQYQRQRVYGPTKQEAEEEAMRVRAKGRGGAGLDAKQVTVGEFLTSWLAGLAGISPSTRRLYTHQLTDHLIPALGHIKLTKLTAMQVRAFVRTEEQAGRAPTTIDAYLTRLRAALSDAVEWGLLERNVARGVRPPRRTETTPLLWTAEETRKFLAANATHPLGPLWQLALGTGCRAGELSTLQWGDVDLDGARIHVQRSATRNEAGKEIVGTTTKGRRTRTLPLPASCVAALKAQWDERPGTPEAFVFVNSRGTRWQTCTLRRRFREACQRAHVPMLHPHSLRHMTATWLAEEGVPMHMIQTILGHAGIQMSLRYGTVTPEMQATAAAALDGHLAITATDSHGILTVSGRETENVRTLREKRNG